MVDGVSVIEQDAPPQDVREFRLGLQSEISAQQKGGVTRLTHPSYGTAYLIDVTDREDPTRKDPKDVSLKGENLGEVFQEDLENPEYNNRFCLNNGVVAVITDKLDPLERKRVYIGVNTRAVDDPQRREITIHILDSAGFTSDSFYVPFSFDSGLVEEYMVREVRDAVSGSGNKDLFSDFRSASMLGSPETV